MPQLGDVLGGVLAEVVRSRVVADMLTADLVGAYRDDPTLSLMSIPRATVREMTVTLRFAVSELTVPDGPEPAAVERQAEEWNRLLAERVLPKVTGERTIDLSDEEVAAVHEHLVAHAPAVPTDRLEVASAGNIDQLVATSVDELLDRYREVPTGLRRRVGTLKDLRAELDREVRAEALVFLDRQEHLFDARRALASRLDVAVRSDELASQQAETIQEIQLTLTMPDIEMVVGDTAPLRPVEGLR